MEADSLVIDPHKHGLQPYGSGACRSHIRRAQSQLNAFTLFGRLVDLVKWNELGLALFCKLLGDCGGEVVAMVDVTDRPNVHMWLRPLEFLLSHCPFS